MLTGLRIDAYLRGAVFAGTGVGPCHRVHAVPVDPRPLTANWMDDLPRVDAHPDEPVLSLTSRSYARRPSCCPLITRSMA